MEWASHTVSTQERWVALLWVEFWKLNAVAVCDSYPGSIMDGCINSLGVEQMFSTPDGNYVYWKVEIDFLDRCKKASTLHIVCLDFEECHSNRATHLAHFDEQ